MRASDFTPHVGTQFVIDADGNPVDTTLAEVRELEGQSGAFRDPFALSFRGPREPVLPQRTYRLEHAELGALDIFLVPVASGESGTVYEAVFN